MTIRQFNDAPLAHYSYAVISHGKMVLVDPSRNPQAYYELAEKEKATIVAVFETHPHADFVSSHLQIHKETGATIFVSELVGASYPHETFDEGDSFEFGDVVIKGIHTPGHSPDGITFHAIDNNTKEEALFTGDTLFIGDVGRPDLREKAGNMTAKRRELAEAMFDTLQTKFNELSDDVLVYPAHGAGSLCGKNMSDAPSSTLGNERQGNWAFQIKEKEEFVEEILKDQPFIPSYFGFNVDINKEGAENYASSIATIRVQIGVNKLPSDSLIIDTRPQDDFKNGHLEGSINIMARNENDKIETWLGAIVQPEEKFYLVVESISVKDEILSRIAKIGYENQLEAIVTLGTQADLVNTEKLDVEAFKSNLSDYTIVDIRNESEHTNDPKFDSALNHPLNDLRESLSTISKEKPLVVHCAGGYRSAAGASILASYINEQPVYDLSEAIKEF